MALIEPGMPCGLCGEPIHDPDVDTFCTTAHAELYYHPEFNVLNDAAVHQSCIDSWTERHAFIAFFNSEIREELVVDRYNHVRYRRSWLTKLWRRFSIHEIATRLGCDWHTVNRRVARIRVRFTEMGLGEWLGAA